MTARTILPPPPTAGCVPCDETGFAPDSAPTIPASAYAPAEGGAPCRCCGGSGRARALCADCGDTLAFGVSSSGRALCAECVRCAYEDARLRVTNIVIVAAAVVDGDELELKLAASVRLARAGVRKFRPANAIGGAA